MTLPKLAVITLKSYEIKKIEDNTIGREDRLGATKANLSAESIPPFLSALRKNPHLSENNSLINFANHVLTYSTALKDMRDQKQELEQIINNIRTNNPSFFAHQTPQGVVTNTVEINAPRML